jgi:dsRNA-specific ribonuclease
MDSMAGLLGYSTHKVALVRKSQLRGTNPVAELNEYAQKHQHPIPVYTEVEAGGLYSGVEVGFISSCLFMQITLRGSAGNGKKDAKQNAAALMLVKLGI